MRTTLEKRMELYGYTARFELSKFSLFSVLNTEAFGCSPFLNGATPNKRTLNSTAVDTPVSIIPA